MSELFVGVRNDGSLEHGLDLDKLQQTFSAKMQFAYPPIYFATKILRVGTEQALAVIVPGSKERPHFAGPSYVRKGSTTQVASDSQFEEVLTARLDKSGEILKWRGKTITVDRMRVEAIHMMGPVESTFQSRVVDCNPFYIALENEAVPLRRVEISFDVPRKSLKLEVYPSR